MGKPYEIIDHTADIGLHVFGSDPAELFGNAAWALTDVITDHRRVVATDSLSLSVTGIDWPDLMVNWLRELLYLWSGKQLLVASVEITQISAQKIAAVASVEPYRPERHRIDNEIKAVTYHQIDVSDRLTGWEATIILDV
jgi:SHS2 domain-containing protein